MDTFVAWVRSRMTDRAKHKRFIETRTVRFISLSQPGGYVVMRLWLYCGYPARWLGGFFISRFDCKRMCSFLDCKRMCSLSILFYSSSCLFYYRQRATATSPGKTGFEPATSGVTDQHSNRLSYFPSPSPPKLFESERMSNKLFSLEGSLPDSLSRDALSDKHRCPPAELEMNAVPKIAAFQLYEKKPSPTITITITIIGPYYPKVLLRPRLLLKCRILRSTLPLQCPKPVGYSTHASILFVHGSIVYEVAITFHNASPQIGLSKGPVQSTICYVIYVKTIRES